MSCMVNNNLFADLIMDIFVNLQPYISWTQFTHFVLYICTLISEAGRF